jgi:hypothetical protein
MPLMARPAPVAISTAVEPRSSRWVRMARSSAVGSEGAHLVALLRQDLDERQRRRSSFSEQTPQESKTDGARLVGHDQRNVGRHGKQVLEKPRQVLLGQTQQAVPVHAKEIVVRARRRRADVETRAAGDHHRGLGAFAVERAPKGKEGRAVTRLGAAEDRGGGAVPEQRAGVEIVPVQSLRRELCRHHRDAAPGAAAMPFAATSQALRKPTQEALMSKQVTPRSALPSGGG